MSKKVASIFDKNDDDHSDHNHDRQQAYFAGGSEHSGQEILGPERETNLIENLLDDARRHADLNHEPSDDTLPVTLWRNGFTVGDNSELRDYASNGEFLSCLRRGEMPPDLASQARSGLVDVKLVNKAFQDYDPSKNKTQTFKGEGYRLGAPAPVVVCEGQSSASGSSTNAASATPSLDEIRQARLARFNQKAKPNPEK